METTFASGSADSGASTAFARCPYLGLPWDRASSFLFPDEAHICTALANRKVSLAHQSRWCMSGGFELCPDHPGDAGASASNSDVASSRLKRLLSRLGARQVARRQAAAADREI